jgi:hypothetical protein
MSNRGDLSNDSGLVSTARVPALHATYGVFGHFDLVCNHLAFLLFISVLEVALTSQAIRTLLSRQAPARLCRSCDEQHLCLVATRRFEAVFHRSSHWETCDQSRIHLMVSRYGELERERAFHCLTAGT